MNAGKVVLSAIAGGVVLFLLGWLLYGILLSDYFAAHYDQSNMRPMEEFVWWAMLTSNVLSALLLALVFTWSNTFSAASGATRGGMIGFIWAFSINLSFYSMSTMISGFAPMLVDALVFTVMMAIAGALVAFILGRGSQAI